MTAPLIPAGVAGEASRSAGGQGAPLVQAGAQDAATFAQLFRTRLGKAMAVPDLSSQAGTPAAAQAEAARGAAPAFALSAIALQASWPPADEGVQLGGDEAPSAGARIADPALAQAAPFASTWAGLPVMPQASAPATALREGGVETGVAQRPGRVATAVLAAARQFLPEGVRLDATPAQWDPLAVTASPQDRVADDGVLEEALRSAPAQTQAMEGVVDAARRVLAGRELPAMQLPLRAPGWEGEFSQRVLWMLGRNSSLAELTLNPPDLGSVEVRLSLSGNEAGAQFFSPHPAVREAIEAALPRLREMLADSGLNLGQAQVSAESFSERRPAEAMPTAAGGDAPASALEQSAARVVLGLVDLYV